MSIPGKVLIALLSALLVAVVASFIDPHYRMLTVFIPAAAAALLAVVLSHRALPMPGAIADSASASAPTPSNKPAKSPVKQDKSATRNKSGKAQRDDKATPNGKGRRARSGKSAGPEEKESKAPQKKADRPSPASTAPLEQGTVKWFNVSKGYGFIIRENGDEIFVHHRSVQGDGRGRLDDGSSVRFRVVTTDKGPQAEDVEPV